MADSRGDVPVAATKWGKRNTADSWDDGRAERRVRPRRGAGDCPRSPSPCGASGARARPTGAGRRSTTPAGRGLGGSSSVRVIIGLVSGFSRVSCRETWRVPVPRIRDRLHRIEPRSPEGRPGGTIRGGWSASDTLVGVRPAPRPVLHVCGMATE